MKVLSFFKKHWFKILSLALIATLSFYVFLFGIEKGKNHEVLKSEQKQQTIFTIWHIETFEGGGKSRIDYLKNIARDIEKKDNSSLFMIKQINPLELEENLKTSKPDIISFGYGVGQIVLSHLTEITNTFDIRDNLILSGSFNNKFYAVPYILSGYAMFAHSTNSSNFHCGQTTFTNPEKIYNELTLSPQKAESQFEAYKQFVYNKNVQLLGTARDLFRINNLNNIGRTNAMITPIDTYTDLIQYLGLINQNKTTKYILELALSNQYQNSLINYSLFSSKHNKLYFSGIYNDMENAILKCRIPNVFA